MGWETQLYSITLRWVCCFYGIIREHSLAAHGCYQSLLCRYSRMSPRHWCNVGSYQSWTRENYWEALKCPNLASLQVRIGLPAFVTDCSLESIEVHLSFRPYCAASIPVYQQHQRNRSSLAQGDFEVDFLKIKTIGSLHFPFSSNVNLSPCFRHLYLTSLVIADPSLEVSTCFPSANL